MVQFNLEPSSQLYFKESSEELDQKIFKISNPSSVAITFKIKTTSPKNYCVRPNVGLILPGATQEIEVFLQPRKDKFLILAAETSEKSVDDVSNPEYWIELETNHKESVTEKRLKCVFGSPLNENGTGSKESSKDSSATELSQAHERIKKLEILLAETKRAKASSFQLTSGIVPIEIASSLHMVNSPQSMFPPLLVAFIALCFFLFGSIYF